LRTIKELRIVIAVAVMVAVLTVLVAPSIDMPETVLREHHVASHSMMSNSSGTLTVVGLVSFAQAFHNDAVHVIENSRILDHGHSQSSLVLRC